MNEQTNKKLLLAATVVIVLNFSSCRKYEDGPVLSLKSKTGRLTGEWVVEEIDNVNISGFGSITLEFERDGDFTFGLSYSYYGYSYSYSEDGQWAWEDNKEAISVVVNGATEEWEIQRLTNKELWFEDESGQEWQCEKE